MLFGRLDTVLSHVATPKKFLQGCHYDLNRDRALYGLRDVGRRTHAPWKTLHNVAQGQATVWTLTDYV